MSAAGRDRPLRVAFDVGGVLSKYPTEMHSLAALWLGCEIYVISDMHPKEKILAMLEANGFGFVEEGRVLSADYQAHGEACKAVLCEELEIDILIDDFIGYVACPGKPPIRLLLMPDASRPYYADTWVTDGSEGDFGRRRKVD